MFSKLKKLLSSTKDEELTETLKMFDSCDRSGHICTANCPITAGLKAMIYRYVYLCGDSVKNQKSNLKEHGLFISDDDKYHYVRYASLSFALLKPNSSFGAELFMEIMEICWDELSTCFKLAQPSDLIQDGFHIAIKIPMLAILEKRQRFLSNNAFRSYLLNGNSALTKESEIICLYTSTFDLEHALTIPTGVAA